MANTVHVDGVKLDIVSGDVSDFDKKVREHIDSGGGWLAYDQADHHYQLHITAGSSVVIRYEH